MFVVLFVDHCYEGWQHSDRRNLEGHSEHSASTLWAVEDIDAQTGSGVWEGNLQKMNENDLTSNEISLGLWCNSESSTYMQSTLVCLLASEHLNASFPISEIKLVANICCWLHWWKAEKQITSQDETQRTKYRTVTLIYSSLWNAI